MYTLSRKNWFVCSQVCSLDWVRLCGCFGGLVNGHIDACVQQSLGWWGLPLSRCSLLQGSWLLAYTTAQGSQDHNGGHCRSFLRHKFWTGPASFPPHSLGQSKSQNQPRSRGRETSSTSWCGGNTVTVAKVHRYREENNCSHFEINHHVKV